MGTIVDKLNKLLNTKDRIKNAIITQGQTVSDSDTFDSYADKILAIDTQEEPVIESLSVTENGTYTAPSGIHGYSPVTIAVPTGPAVEQVTPIITVNSSGLITASATQEAGIVSAGTKTATQQLTTKAATTITPGTSAKTAVSSGVYTTGDIVVKGDSDLVASNIKNGIEIFGVIGTYTGRVLKIGSIDSVTVGYENFNGSRFVLTFPSGFNAASVVSFNIGGFRNGNYTSQPMLGMLDEYSNSIKAHLYNYNNNTMNGLSFYHWASDSMWSIPINKLVCNATDTAVSNIFQYAGYGYYVYLE
jgi:hypothetical protein